MAKEGINKKNQFYVTLIITTVVIGLQWYLMKDVETNGIWEWLLSSLFLFFILPAVVIVFYFKGKLSDFHLSFDFGLKEVLIALISGGIFVGLFFLLMVKLGWYDHFPASNLMFGGKDLFMFFEFLILPLILFFQEFFFRGFVLRSAERVVGIFSAIFLQLLLVLIFEHILGADLNIVTFFTIVIVNLYLNWLVLTTRTVILTFLISWLINIMINFTVFYYLNIS